jgi:tetrapyrrole methylase family protein / MazG family protein
MSAGITIVGLGPGDPSLLTRQAWDWLNQIPEVYLRTNQHPTVADFPEGLVQYSFDGFYERGEKFEAVYAQIVGEVLRLGQRQEGVTYAVPGHPFVAEATCPEIVRRARQMSIPVRVIEGLSFLEPTFTALGVDPYPDLILVDALELGRLNHPMFSPASPALIAQIYSRQVASEVKLTLNTVFPDEYPVRLVHAAGTSLEVVEDLKLYEIDRSLHIGLLTSLYVPPFPKDSSFEAFQELIAHLRAPNGCPWDRKQTHRSLRTSLLEETYEVISALDAEDSGSLREELGDLLLQIVLHSQIAAEMGEFTMEEVMEGIHRKIVYRHPHVFGDVKVDGTDGVLVNWEKLKAAERKANGKDANNGLLDSIPKVYPALSQAQAYQERVGRVGFDWSEIQGVIDKVREELEEVLSAADEDNRAKELGDLLFAVVNLVRWYKVDAESTLRETNQRFRRRFAHVEQRASEMGRNLSDMTLAEMDVFWEEAKDQEK